MPIMEGTMLKYMLAAAMAAALIAAPVAPAMAQAKPETSKAQTAKTEKKAERKLTPQQQKMKDCGPKWQTYKKEKNVKGKAEYQKFLKTCLKG
jgi:Ni/Co efflux regulator RcnB